MPHLSFIRGALTSLSVWFYGHKAGLRNTESCRYSVSRNKQESTLFNVIQSLNESFPSFELITCITVALSIARLPFIVSLEFYRRFLEEFLRKSKLQDWLDAYDFILPCSVWLNNLLFSSLFKSLMNKLILAVCSTIDNSISHCSTCTCVLPTGRFVKRSLL